MAVVNVKSTLITNADASPPVLNNPYIGLDREKSQIGIVTITNGDTNASTYRICRIPSGACVADVEIINTAATSATANIGVLETAANGGGLAAGVAGADAILVPSGACVSSAHATFTSFYYPAIAGAAASPANGNLRIWELLGLAADPFKIYDVAISTTVTATATGIAMVKVSFKV